MKCPSCGFESGFNSAGIMKYCGMCGALLAKACPQCNFLNPLNYRFCGACGAAQPQAEAQPPAAAETPPAGLPAERPLRELEGERRLVSVLMADVHDSTVILERIGGEAWVDLMNRLLQLMEREIQRFGGVVDQFRGDGLLAFFGADAAHEDDPERAVLAGLSIQQAVKGYAPQAEARYPIHLKVRVGVNTGEVIRTSVGDNHPQDTGMGEAITLAARMEASAEPTTVLVSENTYRLARPAFEWQDLGKIMVKGLSAPVPVYRPLSYLSEDDRARQLQNLRLHPSVLLRPLEMQTLTRRVEELSAGRGGIVLVTGEKGMGKNFLIKQVYAHFVAQGWLRPSTASPENSAPGMTPQLTWLSGHCRSFAQSVPYGMWVVLLASWLEVTPEDAPDMIRRRLRERLGDDQIAWCYPYLASLLGLPVEEEFAELVQNTERLPRQIFWAARSWLEMLAQRGPLLITFFSLQWADATSLELLKYCMPLCEDQPALFLLTFRQEPGMPSWTLRQYIETEYLHRLTALELNPFDEAQSRRMIQGMLGEASLTPATLDRLIRKTEGNPYYIVEILHALIEQGILARDEQGNWHETRPLVSLDMPGSLQALLLERLNRLSADERHVLQVAAVIGGVFWRSVLARVVESDAPRGVERLRAGINRLLRLQLIQERSSSPELGVEYVFTPSLIREVVYDSLLSNQRVQLHARVAEALDSCIREDSGLTLLRYESLLAYHYRYAQQPRKELFYTLLAAEKARKLYANQEALHHYTRALEVLQEIEASPEGSSKLYSIRTQRFETLNGRRQVLHNLGLLDASRQDARALLPLADELCDDLAWKVDALLAQPEVDIPDSREDLAAGERMAEEALAFARQAGDPQREMNCLLAVSRKYHRLSNPAWLEAARRALDIAQELGDRRAQANLLLEISKAFGPDHLAEGKQYLDAAFEASRQVDDPALQLDLLESLAAELERRGDYYRQWTEAEQKRLEISRATGMRLNEGHALLKCGQILALYLGDYEAGLALLEQSAEIWQHITSRLYPLLRTIQIKLQQGRLAQAESILQQALPFGERVAAEIGRAGLGLVACQVYNTGDEEHLHAAIEQAGRVLQMTVDLLVPRQYQIAAHCELAESYRLLSQKTTDPAQRQASLAQALQSSQAAVAIYREIGFIQVIECLSEQIFYRHALILQANQQAEEAADYLRQAHEEMLRKHDLIPPESGLRPKYLATPLHRAILQAHADAQP